MMSEISSFDLCTFRGSLRPDKSSNFYALLLMDGDKVAAMLSQASQYIKTLKADSNGNTYIPATTCITKCLSKFANGVDAVVKEHNGITVYSGGDDVLVLLPIDKATKCAFALSQIYTQYFKSDDITLLKDNEVISRTTISAGLIFSHFHVPFTQVLEQAHHQLDEIAKGQNGGNSLAVAVMKPGNLSMQWVTEWPNASTDNPVSNLNTLIEKIKKSELSKGFVYKMTQSYEDLLNSLCQQEQQDSGETTSRTSPQESSLVKQILMAELKKTKDKRDINLQEIADLICGLGRQVDGFNLEPLWLARFIAGETMSVKKNSRPQPSQTLITVRVQNDDC